MKKKKKKTQKPTYREGAGSNAGTFSYCLYKRDRRFSLIAISGLQCIKWYWKYIAVPTHADGLDTDLRNKNKIGEQSSETGIV